jgi:S-adenosylmethionine hydrolase
MRIAQNDKLDLEKIELNVIPDLHGSFVGHIDNYGNIKTTITREDMKGKYEFDDTMEIVINGTTLKARFVDNLFGGNVGELVIYPGSSGKPDNNFLEISAWSHFGDTKDGSPAKTGRDFFKGIMPGMKIEIK